MSIIRHWIEKGYDVQMTKSDDGWYRVTVSKFNVWTIHSGGATLFEAIRAADAQVRYPSPARAVR